MVGEADLAGLECVGPAAHQGHRRGPVVRSAERRTPDQPAGRQGQAGGGVDARRLERVGGAQVGQQPGQPAGQHRLARAGRADQQEVVPAGGRHLERVAGDRLAADVGQVGAGRRRRRRHGLGRVGPRVQAPERPDHQPEGRHRPHHVTADQLRLDRAPLGHDDLGRRQGVDERQRARHRRAPSRRARARRRTRAPSSAPAGTCSLAASSAAAMARSRPAPTLRRPGGARLTVTRHMGHVSSVERSAARTRSRASRQVVSGRPTTVKPGRPWDTWTSTRTGRPSTPSRVADWADASTAAAPHTRES